MRPIIEVQDLWFAYEGRDWVLKGIDLQVFRGELLLLIGQNGCGKSTLAKHFNGLLKPTKGRVLVGGRDTSLCTAAELSKVVGYVFQNPDNQLFAPSAYEEVAFGLRNLGLTDNDLIVRSSLREVGLEHRAQDHPLSLSAGEKERLAIASVIAMDPKVLILDEPTIGQDGSTASRIMATVHSLKRKGTAVIVITHDMELAAEWSERVVVMHEGMVERIGPPQEVLRDVEFLKGVHLSPPKSVEIGESLGINPAPLTLRDLVEALIR